MCEILLLGGTTEGRQLAEYCAGLGIFVTVSVVSQYGEELLPHADCLHIQTAPMDEDDMVRLIRDRQIRLVLDATHPYAVQVTAHARQACSRTGAVYRRLLRQSGSVEGSRVIHVNSAGEAADFLENTQGPVLLTTGSKELLAFAGMTDFRDRVYARVLPAVPSLQVCGRLGLGGKHIVAMQGPFSEEMNRVLLKELGISWMVTKEAGAAGGFDEKLAAAASCGVSVVVIGRPAEEEGITLSEARQLLSEFAQPVISLIGTGMGGWGQMTIQASQALLSCQVLFGASRMLEDAERAWTGRHPGFSPALYPVYQADQIVAFIRENWQWRNIGVLYSGDTGFYSGARQMTELCGMEKSLEQYKVRSYPGISSLSYLCAAVCTSWEDVFVISLHGKEADVSPALKIHSKVFVLLDHEHTPQSVCRGILNQGMSRALITVGQRLSYEDERIITGSPDMISGQAFDSLCVMLIQLTEKTAGRDENIK